MHNVTEVKFKVSIADDLKIGWDRPIVPARKHANIDTCYFV